MSETTTEPTVTTYALGVLIRVAENANTGRARDNYSVLASVDAQGMVWLERRADESEDERQRAIRFLLHQGFAEWQRIGPEDSELFLTDEAARRYAPLMRALQESTERLAWEGEES